MRGCGSGVRALGALCSPRSGSIFFMTVLLFELLLRLLAGEQHFPKKSMARRGVVDRLRCSRTRNIEDRRISGHLQMKNSDMSPVLLLVAALALQVLQRGSSRQRKAVRRTL